MKLVMLTKYNDFIQQVMDPGERPTLDNWHSCITDLCPIYVRENGKTYDASNKTLKVSEIFLFSYLSWFYFTR